MDSIKNITGVLKFEMIKRHCLCFGLALVAEPAGCRLADFSVYFETSPSYFGRLLVVRAAAEYQVALR